MDENFYAKSWNESTSGLKETGENVQKKLNENRIPEWFIIGPNGEPLTATEEEVSTLLNDSRTRPKLKGRLFHKGEEYPLRAPNPVDLSNYQPEIPQDKLSISLNTDESNEPSWTESLTGRIPTLTDVGNRIVQGFGTLTGQIQNPFEKQIEDIEAQIRTTKIPEKKKELEAQLKTLKEINKGWSSYDVAKQEDVSAAPGWMQGVHNAARTLGDTFDVVDVGTAFLPVGAIGKGAAFVGKRIPTVVKGAQKVAKYPGLAKGAGKVVDVTASHPILTDAGEQALIEGAHGAFTYRPEENESMGTNALEQGALAGGLQGLVTGIGGRRWRAVKALPENQRIETALKELRNKGVSVPEYSPMARAGKSALTDEEAEALKNVEFDKTNKVFGRNETVSEDDVNEAIKLTIQDMQSNPILYNFNRERNVYYPSKDMEIFKKKFVQDGIDERGQVFGHYISPWEADLRGRFPNPEDVTHGIERATPEGGKEWVFTDGAPTRKEYTLNDILHAAYSRPYSFTTGPRIGEGSPIDVSAEADRFFVSNLLNGPKRGITTFDPKGNLVTKETSNKYNELRGALQNVDEIKGLAGLNYASNPLERVAEKPINRFISQVPVVKRIPKMYEAQNISALRRGDVAGAWERAKANLFLDMLREGGEGGLDWLADKYGD